MNKVRPGITIVRITGFGQTGPEAPRAGWGVIGEAKGGLRYLCAYPQDISPLPPVRAGISIGDSIAGLYGALGAVSSILEAKMTNRKEPRVIDVALGEAVLSFLEGIVPGVCLHRQSPPPARLQPANRRAFERLPQQRRRARADRRQLQKPSIAI